VSKIEHRCPSDLFFFYFFLLCHVSLSFFYLVYWILNFIFWLLNIYNILNWLYIYIYIYIYIWIWTRHCFFNRQLAQIMEGQNADIIASPQRRDENGITPSNIQPRTFIFLSLNKDTPHIQDSFLYATPRLRSHAFVTKPCFCFSPLPSPSLWLQPKFLRLIPCYLSYSFTGLTSIPPPPPSLSLSTS